MIKEIFKKIYNKQAFLYSFFKLISEFSYFLIPLILAKILNPEGFASFSLSLMVILFFISLFINSYQTPFIIHLTKSQTVKKRNIQITTQFIFFILSSLIFIVFYFVLFGFIKTFASITTKETLSLIYLYFGYGIRIQLGNYLMGIGERKTSGIYSILNGFFIICGIIYLILNNNLSLQNIFLIYLLSPLIAIVFFYKKFNIKFKWEYDYKNIKNYLCFLKWQIIGLIAIYLVNWGDNFVLRYFVETKDIGVYNLAYQIFKAGITAIYFINDYLLVSFGRNIKNKKVVNSILEKRKNIFYLSIFCIFISMIILPGLIRFFYGAPYSKAIVILEILLPSLIFMVHTIFYTPLFNALQKYKAIQVINLVHLITNIGLDLLLIPILGITGAAIATSFAYLIRAVLYEIYYRKYTKIIKNN